MANAAAFAGVGRVIAAKSDVFAAYDAAAWAQAIDAVAPQGTVSRSPVPLKDWPLALPPVVACLSCRTSLASTGPN